MARTKKSSELLKGFGKAFEVLKAIVDAVLSLGGNDADLERVITDRELRHKIAELIVQATKSILHLHAINCDAVPFVPEGWSWHEADQLPNRVKGIFTWGPTKVKLYLSEKQKGGQYIKGNNLREELEPQPVLPAQVLDHLLANPNLIPEEWKGKAVFFWGTIYRHSGDDLYVRYLCWFDGAWYWRCYWLGSDFNSTSPAALRAS